MENELAGKLATMGFLSVLGTIETIGERTWTVDIHHNIANSWNRNKGIVVVYDNRGVPWIRRGRLSLADLTKLGLKKERQAVNVPHSNDGGRWVEAFLDYLGPIAPTEYNVGMLIDMSLDYFGRSKWTPKQLGFKNRLLNITRNRTLALNYENVPNIDALAFLTPDEYQALARECRDLRTVPAATEG